MLVAGAVTPEGILAPARLEIDRDTLVSVEEAPGADTDDSWALPGFVDTHTHGAVGVDLGSADEAGVRRVLDFARRHGTTTQFASLATDRLESMCRQVELLAGFVEAGELAGIHLEGPFLAEARCGAHDPALLRDPTPEAVDALLEAGRGTIAMVTLAPERAGAAEAIARFVEAGVRVGFGHSDASAELCRDTVAAGARIATHLFNAMAPIHHRRPGPVPVLLADGRVGLELVCDGVHLSPEVVTLVGAAAGWDRVLLVTDAMAAAGLGDGDYALGALRARVADGVARVLHDDGSGTEHLGNIAGSTLTMDAALRFLLAVGTGLESAAAAAASNPARWHGLARVGVIAADNLADLVLTDPVGNVRRVMRRGAWLD
ncbi:amidohydrolase family protein [Naumannella sp. ID2617S]|nr:amidohydrolase family protein [Naumannella sp. ID2617S]